MLSQKIRSLRERLQGFSHEGIPLPANQVEILVKVLRNHEIQARQLEQLTIKPVAKLTEQHLRDGKVTILPIIARDNSPVPHPFEVINGGRDGEPYNSGDAA